MNACGADVSGTWGNALSVRHGGQITVDGGTSWSGSNVSVNTLHAKGVIYDESA